MAGCGSCSPTENLVLMSYLNATDFTIGVSAPRLWKGRWNAASFPSVPCPSPQLIFWEFHNGSTWRGVGAPGSGQPVELNSGTISQNATAGVWYSRFMIYNTVGNWPLRIRMACGSAFISPTHHQNVIEAGGRHIHIC